MASEDEATLKLLEDTIRRVVREELERHRPSLAGRVWGDPKSNVWSVDVPSAPEFVYTAGRHD